MKVQLIRAGLLCWLLLPGAVWALSSDRGQPIHIEADSVEIDDLHGISVYRGNVRYTQGTIRLLADQATIYTEGKKLQKFIAEGKPARFSQRPDNSEEDLEAEAEQIEYRLGPERVFFRGGALLVHQGNTFAGNVIEYDAALDVVSARKGEDGDQRVKVIIQPREKQEESGHEPSD